MFCCDSVRELIYCYALDMQLLEEIEAFDLDGYALRKVTRNSDSLVSRFMILLHLQKDGMIPSVLELTTPEYQRGYFGAHLNFLKTTGYYRGVTNVKKMANDLSVDGDNDEYVMGRLANLSI